MRKEIVPDAQGAYVEFENSGIGCVVEVECHFADATADVDANATAAALANINESPDTRTRRQLMLAIQSGSNAAAGCRARDDNVLDDSPVRRMRQRLGQQQRFYSKIIWRIDRSWK